MDDLEKAELERRRQSFAISRNGETALEWRQYASKLYKEGKLSKEAYGIIKVITYSYLYGEDIDNIGKFKLV